MVGSNLAAHLDGLRVQMLTPSQFSGTAQVTLSAACSSPIGSRLPTQVSFENTADVPSIFMPFRVMPSLSSAVTRRVGTVRPSRWYSSGWRAPWGGSTV